jgi:short subunit dehydrogenase-like uncharacterized protein
MPDPLLVYGATGFTGRLVVDALLARGLRPVLAGRSRPRLEEMSAALDLPHRVGEIDNSNTIASLLTDIDVVLLAAGPFSQTAVPMMSACLEAGVHYLDLTGECKVFDALSHSGRTAVARGCMVMPGCGFDVVATDCLARHVATRLDGASQLAIGISGLNTATRGSLRTIAEQAGQPIVTRRRGSLASVEPGVMRRQFAYGCGDGWSTAVTWGDVVTAFHSTGIPDITVYFEETAPLVAMLTAGRTFGPLLQTGLAQSWLRAHAELFPDGPRTVAGSDFSGTIRGQATDGCTIVAEATTADARLVSSRLKTPDAYSFSAQSAATIAQRALAGDTEAGFQTPARVYGADFVMQFAGVTREDLV